MVPIACGKCLECSKQKSRMWQSRLLEEIKTNKNGIFVTLTFNDVSYRNLYKYVITKAKEYKTELNNYDIDNKIATRATRLFLERWRKKHKKSVKHWLVTELGNAGTENMHLHGIIWTKIS